MKYGFALVFFFVACKSTNPADSNTAAANGFENNWRQPGVSGMPPVGQSVPHFVTGRTSMGTRDPNQCQAAYSGNEKVRVTYQENGATKSEDLYIAGVNNASFGSGQNAYITDACGTVVEVTFNGGGKTLKQRFVVVDRIYEAHAQERPNLDIAKEAYYAIQAALGVNDNFEDASTKTIAQGSYIFVNNPDCRYEPGKKTKCADGW